MHAFTKQQSIQHLFWRVGFGATPDVIQRESHRPIRKVVRDLLESDEPFTPLTVVAPETVVNRPILRNMVATGAIDRVMLKEKIKEDTEHLRDLNVLWVDRMASGKDALREKMALFWHGHFACRVRNPAAMQQYLNTIRQHALGTAPKRAQAKTTLELYRYHEERLRKLGPQALERFYQHFVRPAAA